MDEPLLGDAGGADDGDTPPEVVVHPQALPPPAQRQRRDAASQSSPPQTPQHVSRGLPPRPPSQGPPRAAAGAAPPPRRSFEGGVGVPGTGKKMLRRISDASEQTPLSLHGPTERGESLLLLDETKESQYGVSRWKATLEALVSKVFWDGFMWELFAFLSLRLGQGPTTPVYFLLTGVGAALGVFMGQLAYASGVYAVTAVTTQARGEVVPTAKTLLMGLEFAALLSAGAFLAGFTWEPVVNGLLFALAPATTDANAVFVLILVCTLFIQGTVFFVGVQGARYLFSSLLHFEAIDPPLSSHTMTYDGTLSLSIGGAQGLFVATMTFASNPLTKTFGVQSTTGPLVGSLRGGGSMVIGFLVIQTMQNIVFPASTTWADARKKGRQQLRYTREEILLPYRTPYG